MQRIEPFTIIRDRFKLIFLTCLIFFIYLPSLKSGFFVFDDIRIVNAVERIAPNEILHYLTQAGGRYWRPVVMGSFFLDVHFLGANSSLMHLHNILLHICNAILVFIIARHLLNTHDGKKTLPFLAATLFAIHPINTEAVSWISGRTDLYAALFSLTGVYFFLLSIRSKKIYHSLISTIFILTGCMAKEVAFALFPAAIFSLIIIVERHQQPRAFKPVIRNLLKCWPFLIGATSYLWLRDRAFINVDQGISKIVEGSENAGTSLIDQIHSGVTALGFYIKKLVFPYPLNFAIDNISDLYLWVGLLALVIALAIMFKRRVESSLLVFMFFTISPALLNAIFHIAWTPLAERYLYLPSAFLCIYIFTIKQPLKVSITSKRFFILMVFASALLLTINRNKQWQDPSILLADALKQNPDNISLKINYAITLVDKTGPDSARIVLTETLDEAPKQQAIRRNLALIALESLNKPEVARDDLSIFFSDAQKPENATLEVMIKVNKERLNQGLGKKESIIKEELFESYKKYHIATRNPSFLFHAIEYASTETELHESMNLLEDIIKTPSTQTSTKERAQKALSTIIAAVTK